MVFQKKIILLGILLLSLKVHSQNELWANISLTSSDYSITNKSSTGLGLGLGLTICHEFTKSSSLSIGFELKNVKSNLYKSYLTSTSNNSYLPIKYIYGININNKKIEGYIGINTLIQGKGEVGWNEGNVVFTKKKQSGFFPLLNFGVGYIFLLKHKTQFTYCKIQILNNIGFSSTEDFIIVDESNNRVTNQKLYGNFMEVKLSIKLKSS